MDKVDFKRLLFRVAFCTMACDGHIDKREVDEMKVMGTHTSFFDGVDLSSELSKLVDELDRKGTKVIEELFSMLRENSLNPIQELLILEVAMRIINSDQKHDDNEIRFISLLRAKLELHDEIIRDRFGDVALLDSSVYSQEVFVAESDAQLAKGFTLPTLNDFDDAVSGFTGAE